MLKLEMPLLFCAKSSPSDMLNIRVRLKYFEIPSNYLTYSYTKQFVMFLHLTAEESYLIIIKYLRLANLKIRLQIIIYVLNCFFQSNSIFLSVTFFLLLIMPKFTFVISENLSQLQHLLKYVLKSMYRPFSNLNLIKNQHSLISTFF